MPECGQQAILLVTITPAGTATNVARKRVFLRCHLESNHEGPHRDTEHGEEWEAAAGRIPTLFRQEDELP